VRRDQLHRDHTENFTVFPDNCPGAKRVWLSDDPAITCQLSYSGHGVVAFCIIHPAGPQIAAAGMYEELDSSFRAMHGVGEGHGYAWFCPQVITQGIARPILLFASPSETEWSYHKAHQFLTEVCGGVDPLEGKDCVCDGGPAVQFIRSCRRLRCSCLWHIVHGFGAACEAGVMILRNALWTMTQEEWEAKREAAVELANELVGRDLITPPQEAKLYTIIDYNPRTGDFGPFRDAMMHRAPHGTGACQSSSERFHEYAGDRREMRLGLVQRTSSIIQKMDARIEKTQTHAARDPARDLVKRLGKMGGTLETCDCARRAFNNLHYRALNMPCGHMTKMDPALLEFEPFPPIDPRLNLPNTAVEMLDAPPVIARTWIEKRAEPFAGPVHEEPSSPATAPFTRFMRHLAAQVLALAGDPAKRGNERFVESGSEFANQFLTAEWVRDPDFRSPVPSADEVSFRTLFIAAWWEQALRGLLDSDTPPAYFRDHV
jgi:hypothetical protein